MDCIEMKFLPRPFLILGFLSSLVVGKTLEQGLPLDGISSLRSRPPRPSSSNSKPPQTARHMDCIEMKFLPRPFLILGFLSSLVVGKTLEQGLPLDGISSLRSRPPRPSSSNSKPPQTESDCGGTRTNLKDGDHGVIESPGYPGVYKPGLDCVWRIEAEEETIIQATVFELRTKSPFLSDSSDSLFVTLDGNWNQTQRFSGDMNAITPLVLVSENNAISFRFRSSRFSEGSRGFRIIYHGRSTGKPAASEPAHDVYVVVVCNYAPVSTPTIFPAEGEALRRRQLESTSTAIETNPNPFLVALVLDDQQFCSGTLVSNRHVVTSAHCTRGVQKIDMMFGTNNLAVPNDNVQRREVSGSSVTEHPNFDPITGANDISVIELAEPVEITKFVVPAGIPTWEYIGTTFGGFRGEIVGWGDPKSGTVFTTATSRQITISPNVACLQNKGYSGLLMCSRGIETSSICQADSGSPIITRAAYCGGPTNQVNNGDNGTNNQAQKPPRPQNKPNNGKPNNPVKPGKPSRPNTRDEEPKYQSNVLLGITSYGSCEKGFSFTRITAYLDFLSQTIGQI